MCSERCCECEQHDCAHQDQVNAFAVLDVAEELASAGGGHVWAQSRLDKTGLRSRQDVVVGLIGELRVVDGVPAAGEMGDPQ